MAEPTVLQMAFSSELIVATASLPIAFCGYEPLCDVLRIVLRGGAPSDDLVNFYVTVTGLLFGFIVSNTFYFLCVCVRCAARTGSLAGQHLDSAMLRAHRRYSQQEELFEAIYKEAAAVNRLLEEAECALVRRLHAKGLFVFQHSRTRSAERRSRRRRRWWRAKRAAS